MVALDGTLIAKNGNVTGGVSSGMEAKSKRWDDKAVEGGSIGAPDCRVRCDIWTTIEIGRPAFEKYCRWLISDSALSEVTTRRDILPFGNSAGKRYCW